MGSKHHEFGPWTTSLDCGSRMELSAFWRRRLSRLGSLAGLRRLGPKSLLLLCLVGGAMLLVPRVQLEAPLYAQAPAQAPAQASAPTQAQRAAEAKESAEEQDPFTATFSNGVKVQLVGLCFNPSKAQQWWAPDGTLMEKVPYDTVRALMSPPPSGLAREICWRWLDVPENGDVETKWLMDPPNQSGGGRPYDSAGNPVAGLSGSAVGLPGKPVKCTLRFSVSLSATPWETVFRSTGTVGTTSRQVDGLPHSAMFGERVASDGGTAVTVTHQIPNKSVRLVAIDKTGETYLPTKQTGSGSNGITQMSYRIASLAPSDIDRLELQTQTRQYETIEFRDVSLHPDVPSEVKVIRLGPDGKAEQLDVAGAKAKAAEGAKVSPESKAASDGK